jgi:uncharacterized protein YjbI with pentapeptide repeats
MRTWKTTEDLLLLDRIVQALRSGECLQPGGPFGGDPVNLQGLTFPDSVLCAQFNLPTLTVSRVSGHQEFTSASLQRVDLAKAKLDHSVWVKCMFRGVCFDHARLLGVRFFGCNFFDCSFVSVSLKDASFSVAQDGTETAFHRCTFIKSEFRAASNYNPVFRDVRFADCKLGGFVFNQPLCEAVEFSGKYKELTFKGLPGGRERNRLQLNLRNAQIVWLHANHGLDLGPIVLPADGSCFIVGNRKVAIERMCDRLLTELPEAKVLAKILRAIFSDRSISPLSPDQETFLVSQGMMREIDGALSDQQTSKAYQVLRRAAQDEGFLLREGGKGDAARSQSG